MYVKFGDWKHCGFWDFREERAIRKIKNNNNKKKDSIETKKTIKDSEEFGIF